MRLREPVVEVEPMPDRLAVFTASDWPKPKPGSPFHESGVADGDLAGWTWHYQRMAWTRARRDWDLDHDPEYQEFKANGYRRNG